MQQIVYSVLDNWFNVARFYHRMNYAYGCIKQRELPLLLSLFVVFDNRPHARLTHLGMLYIFVENMTEIQKITWDFHIGSLLPLLRHAERVLSLQ